MASDPGAGRPEALEDRQDLDKEVREEGGVYSSYTEGEDMELLWEDRVELSEGRGLCAIIDTTEAVAKEDGAEMEIEVMMDGTSPAEEVEVDMEGEVSMDRISQQTLEDSPSIYSVEDGIKSPPEKAAPLQGSEQAVRQLSWGRSEGLSMMIDVHIGRMRIPAIVDTAAQVSLVSSSLCRKLQLRISGEQVQLRNAQAGSVMTGNVLRPVGLQIGGHQYAWELIEADINDQFILGLDFLTAHKCKINLEDNSFEFPGGEKIFAPLMKNGDVVFNVCRVTVKKRVTVPALCVKFVNAKFHNPVSGVDFSMEPNLKLPVAVMAGVVRGESPRMCIVNFSEEPVTLKRHDWLGTGVEVEEVFLDTDDEESGESQSDQQQNGSSDQGNVRMVHIAMPEEETLDNGQTGPSPSPESSENGQKDLEELDDGQTGQGPSPESNMEQVESLGGKERDDDGASSQQMLGDGKTGPGPSPEPDVEREAPRQILVPDSWIAAAEELPQHVRKLYIDTLTYLDSGEQAQRLREVLIEYADVFAKHDLDIGHFNELVHYIKTGQAHSIKQHMRRTPLGFEHAEQKTLKSMKDAGVIEPSNSDWASPPVLVRKKDNSWRYCIDFRALNTVTVKDAYPLPRIDDCIDSLAGKELFCTLDMNSGYWQIPIAPEDRHKTAFITRYGLYQFLRMPFGTSNAPATFQRCINSVLAGLIWDTVIVYLDDVNITGQSFDDMLQNLKTVLNRFRKYGLKLKPSKCKLFRREVHFLGRITDRHGVRMTKEHIQDVLNWPVPANRKELERFLGFINYHRNYLQALAGKTAILFALLGVRKKWAWTDEHTQAFYALRQAMTEAPVLAYPNATDLFILDTDASDFAIGAELSQLQDGKERTISYASKSLCSKQQGYCTTRKELLAVVVFVRHYRHYLLGRKFVVRTDHASLVWLMRFKNPGGQICRWLQELSNFDFSIQHRQGNKHSNADGLSRIPERQPCDCYVAGQEVSTLPCGGCEHCVKVHRQWHRFEEDVDDVVPLSLKHLTKTAPEVQEETADVRSGWEVRRPAWFRDYAC